MNDQELTAMRRALEQLGPVLRDIRDVLRDIERNQRENSSLRDVVHAIREIPGAVTIEKATAEVAQAIWQMYAADTGTALPAGQADRLAHAAVNALTLTEETIWDKPGWKKRLVGPWEQP